MKMKRWHIGVNIKFYGVDTCLWWFYAVEMYPSEATRKELSEKLGLTDWQLQMWFCHRRLNDTKEAARMVATNSRTTSSAGMRGLMEYPGNEMMAVESGRIRLWFTFESIW
ncbi:homeobox-DDT domain protein RLT1 [Forsythia ovata]|uniref:Homeobox-DDT domain protein RLT1 n=1 Tax=Forsythia ovata TaxID=205694 RepID=A0ABD1SR01_9LAMI